jgi:hypothetical protein
MKKYGSGTYHDGFAQGWHSVHGAKADVPTFISRPIPAGKTPY